jgi:glutamate/aspartate transport system substrate-binding protein
MSLSVVKLLARGRVLSLCFAVGVSISAPVWANDTLARIRQTQTITIAHREASVPFSYIDENTRRPVGYTVDLCLKIAEAVKRELKLPNLKIEFLSVNSISRISAIADGKADLECGSTTNNAERRKQVAFTIPHFIAATRMIVRVDSGIKNWSDLHDKRVVTTRGTTTVKLLNDRDKVRSLNLKLIEGVDHDESFVKVERGDAEAFTMDDVLLYGLRAHSKNPSGFEIVGDPLSAEPYAIALRRDDPGFKSLVDREMAHLIDEGELVKLYDKWFMRPIPPKNVNMRMPMSHLLRESLRFPTDKVAD